MKYIGKGYKSSLKAFNDFEQKCNEIHNFKYSYDKFEYLNNNTKSIIMCPNHSEFTQRPSDHLQGKGCPECAEINRRNARKIDQSEFLQSCKKVHKDRYLLNNVVYTGIKNKIIVTCRVHGDFTIGAETFRKGQNCPQCASIKRNRTKTKSLETFIKEASNKHNNFYDYSLVRYVSDRTPVTIICPDHGAFEQTPNAHLAGKSCSLCTKNVGGFKPTLDSYFYYLKVRTKDIVAYKIGITNHSIKKRYTLRDRAKIEVLYFLKMSSGYEARRLETYLKRKYSEFRYQGKNILKDGNSELYDKDILKYDSYRVELRAIELALKTSTSPTTFTQAAKLVDKIEKTI